MDKSEYLTKEQTKLKLKVTDQNGDPIRAHLGLSVYDHIYDNPEDCKTIESHYLLSSQLKGNLYSPNYYFDKKNEDRKQALNLLLLTQGWRRYIWNEQNLKAQKNLEGLYIKDHVEGKLTYLKKRKHSPEQIMVSIHNPLEKNIKLFIALDSLDRFFLNTEHLKLGSKLFIEHFGTDRDRIQVTIKNPFNAINKIKENKQYRYPFVMNTEKERYNESRFNLWASKQERVMLNEVEIKGKKNHVYREKYLGKLDSLAKLEMSTDYVCELNVLNCLDHPINSDSKNPVEGEVYVKTLYLTGGRFVHKRHDDEKYFRTVYLQPYKYPKLTDAYLMERYNLMWTEGYYEKKEFYKPIYDEVEQINGFPDYRNTLYWNPNIITDEKGEATVEFFCSDLNTIFLGKIEGVSSSGLLGVENFEFAVRKLEE